MNKILLVIDCNSISKHVLLAKPIDSFDHARDVLHNISKYIDYPGFSDVEVDEAIGALENDFAWWFADNWFMELVPITD